MKRFFLPLLSLVLLSTSAWADNVLFKMVMMNTGSINVDASSELNLSNYAVVIGGTATLQNVQTSQKTVCTYTDNVGYVRIESSGDAHNYIHITLPEALQVGDKILYQDSAQGDHHSILITSANSRTRYNNSRNTVTAGTEFTVPQASNELAGATELWVWKDTGLAYIKSLVITRAGEDENVKFYDFEGAEIDGASTSTPLANGLTVHNDASGNSAIEVESGVNTLKNPGDAENRSVSFVVTDPCTIEVWAKGRGDARDLFLREIDTDFAHATKNTIASAMPVSTITKATYNYTDLVDSKTIHISTSGYANIIAIRVKYAKIRPAADLTASTSDVYMRVGDRKSFSLTTSSDAAITRSWGTHEGEIGNLNVEETTHTYTFTATRLGDVEMIFTQAATADYRAGSVTVNLHIQDATESVTTIDNTNRAQEGATEPRELTVNNITVIGDDASATIGAGNNTYVSNSVRYIKNKSYTISVPTNCKIKSVKFTGMSNESKTSDDTNQTYVTIDGTNSSTFQYVKINNIQQTPTEYTFSGLNASNVTFHVANKCGLLARIELTIAEESSYPLTIANGWASFYCPNDFVQLPEGLTAYYATGYDGEAILLAEVEGQIIRSDRAVVIAGSDGTHTLDVVVNPGAGNFDNFTSALSYTVKRTPLPSGTIYCLNGEIGAFQQYNGEYIPANKAYYRVTTPKGSAPRAIPMRIVQKDNTATSIENTEFIPLDKNAPVYNLQGQQVQITAPGIYVQNGHKYLILQ